MGFESGSVGFMMFTVPQGLPPTCIDRFAAYALPPIDTLSTGSISGWVTGRHLLDSAITNETAHFAGRLRLALAKAERKVPESLLRAECRMEELAVMAAEGKDYVDRRTRSEIKRQVTERLLPRMPPTLTGIPIVYEAGSHILYAGATTEKQHDALVLALREALGVTAIAVTPLTAAVERKHVRVDELPPCSFSPEIEDILGGNTPGKDFLTWLWFFFEARGGTMQVDGQTCAVMIEGPLTFYIEGQGAHVAVLRNGSPLVASEAKAALVSGKKLQRARVVLARGDETWSAMLDADTFVLRSMKLPKADVMDAVSRFEHRMLSLERFRETFLAFYDRFLEERTDEDQWVQTCGEIRRWVAERRGA